MLKEVHMPIIDKTMSNINVENTFDHLKQYQSLRSNILLMFPCTFIVISEIMPTLNCDYKIVPNPKTKTGMWLVLSCPVTYLYAYA